MLSDDLHWFVTLAERGQVTAAARELHLSQPTLTRMLQRLEGEIGTELFDRHGRRITLNACGEVLHRHATRALDELATAREEIATLIDPDRGTVRLDFLHSLGPWLVPTLLTDFRGPHPGIAFRLYQGAAGALTARVVDGRADVALVSPRPTVEGIVWHRLTEQRLALAVPRTHRLARRRRVRLGDVSGESIITMPPNFGMRRIFDDLCAATGFEPRITFESAELATMGGLVSAGLGVAVMPVQRHQPGPEDVVLVPLADQGASRDIGAIWRAGRAAPEPVQRFVGFVGSWPGPTGR